MATQCIITIPQDSENQYLQIAENLYGATFDNVQELAQRVYNEIKKLDYSNAWNTDSFKRVFSCMTICDFVKKNNEDKLINEGFCSINGFITMVFIKNI